MNMIIFYVALVVAAASGVYLVVHGTRSFSPVSNGKPVEKTSGRKPIVVGALFIVISIAMATLKLTGTF